jgi:rfaE bifunctional protein kinase chain/domain
LRRERISAQLHTDTGLRTTIKLRVIGRQQQLVRVDFETPPTHEALASKLRDFKRLLRSHHAVILSDYGKGGLTHIVNMIRAARAAGKPVLVDPKGDDYRRYAGASLLTPNRGEFREVAGGWKTEAELTRKAHALATLGVMLASGMALEDAVRYANRAAGIVVGKFGTAVAYPQELFGGTRDEGT